MATQKLSNEELEIRLREFVSKERFLLHIILDHIKEVDRRKLFLDRAYPTLFEYLVKELGYSASAAMRRQEAARLLRDLPELGPLIQNGKINLSQLGELSKGVKQKENLEFKKTGDRYRARLTAEKKSDLIAKIQDQSTAETQKIISSELDLPMIQQDRETFQGTDSVRLEITLTKEQYGKLLKCRDKTAHKLRQKNERMVWSAILAELADQYLQSKQWSESAEATKNRRKAEAPEQDSKLPKSERETLAASKKKKPSVTKQRSSSHPGDTTKYLSQRMRDSVLLRDQKCQFRDPLTQRICGATFSLEVDHRVPKWAHSHEPNVDLHCDRNLQVLCTSHNQLKYRREARLH